MDPNDPWTRHIYLFFAAVAGGITSLSFAKWKAMGPAEIVLTVFVGASFAWFFMPWVAHEFFHMDEANIRGVSALCYFGATGANVLLPEMILRVKKRIRGDETAGGEGV